MITTKGQELILKFLMGHVPSYAESIAYGIGAMPIKAGDAVNTATINTWRDKTQLDFEIYRTKIDNVGYVTDVVGTPTIVFTASMPKQDRYDISEIGILSASQNPAAPNNDSKMLLGFSTREKWNQSVSSVISPVSTYVGDLSNGGVNDIVLPVGSLASNAAFFTNTDNAFFATAARSGRFEYPRYMGYGLMAPGNFAGSYTATTLSNTSYLSLGVPEKTFNFDTNSQNDLIKIAYSVITTLDAGVAPTYGHALTLQFVCKNGIDFAYATLSTATGATATITNTTANGAYTLAGTDAYPYNGLYASNRYRVDAFPLSAFTKSAGFTWSSVTEVRLLGRVNDSLGSPSASWFFCFDAMRFDNIDSYHPMFGLTGYTIAKTGVNSKVTILKDEGTTNLVEFRFAVNTI